MTRLSSRDIMREVRDGSLEIEPFNQQSVQPASYDVRLANAFMDPMGGGRAVDPQNIPENLMKHYAPTPEEQVWLKPGGFVLGETLERFYIPSTMSAVLDGKSTLGRLGLQIHATAGFFDPGFRGTGTLELCNLGPFTILLTPGMFIGQMRFEYLHSQPLRLYGDPELGSHYQGQSGPTPARS